MKKMCKTVCFILSVVVLTACSGTRTTPERMSEVSYKVQSGDYEVQVDYANPMRGRQIYLNYDYNLKIRNDSAFAFLPYYGVAHSAPYGGGEGGIKFSEPMKDYVLSPNKRNDGWDIRFKVHAKDYNYDVFMSVFNNGSVNMTFNSYERDPISFSGKVGGLETKE